VIDGAEEYRAEPGSERNAGSQTVVSDGAEEYRAEPGSERNAGSQTNIFPVNSD